MPNDETVSVVVVSWNTRDLLRDCLASLEASARRAGVPLETIVVDNASRDGSPEMVEAEFPRCVLVRNADNPGFAAANNQGLKRISGRWVMLLNPDTYMPEPTLGELLELLRADPKAGAVGPKLIGKNGETQISCYPFPTLSREMWRLLHLDKLHSRAVYPFAQEEEHSPRNVDSIQGACMLIRREALDEIGLLDERFYIYSEEIDLCRRLRDRGWEIYWAPNIKLRHYGGESTRQVARKMFLQLYQSKIEYFRKHSGRIGALAYKLVLLVTSALRLAFGWPAMLLRPSKGAEMRNVMTNYAALMAKLPTL